MTAIKMGLGPSPLPQKEQNYEICGHEAHFVEVAFMIVIPVGIGLAITAFFKEIAILSKLEAIILTAFMALALVYLWNYETTKKVAQSAKDLQANIELAQQNVQKMVEQNEQLSQGNKEMSLRLETFRKAIGLLGGSVKNMDVIEKKMSEILGKSGEAQNKRRALFEEQSGFIEKQEADMLDRQKALMQQRLKDQCLAVDEDKDGLVSVGTEVNKIKKYVKEAGIEWDGTFEAEKKKGDKVPIFEIMDQLDKIFEAHYSKMQDSLGDKRRAARAVSVAVRETAALDKQTEKKS